MQYSTNSTTLDAKTLHLFDNQADRDEEKIKNVVQSIDILNHFDVYEYFGNLNTNKDDKHFILNGKYIFRCQNQTQRELFINAIIESIHFNSEITDAKDDQDLDDSILLQNNVNGIVYTFKPLYFYNEKNNK